MTTKNLSAPDRTMTHPDISYAHEITLPDEYAHCVWRPYTRADMQALADLIYADDVAAGIENYRMNEAELAEEYDEKYNLDTSTRLLQTPDGSVIARVEVHDDSHPPVRTGLSFTVHPQHVHQGLEALLLGWGIQCLQRAIERCPEDARVVVQVWTPEHATTKQAALHAAGLAVVRHFYRMLITMTEEPALVNLPVGFSIRTINMPDELEAYVTVRADCFRDHWGFVEQPLEKLLEQTRTWFTNDSKWSSDLCYLVIEDATGTIAALCNCRIEEWGDPSVGYVATLGTRRAYRGQGIALAMLAHAFREFWRRDQTRVALHVDASSLTGAVGLYERAGMAVDQIESTYELELRPGHDLMRQTVA